MIIAVVIVMFLIVRMGERLFVREYEVTTYFKNAAGLSPGVTVALAGVPIGKVKKVQLLIPDEVTRLGRKGTLVRVVLLIEYQYGIPIDSELVLARTAILGEQTLNFRETETMKYLPKDGSAVVWNTRLPPGPTEELSKIFEALEKDFGSLVDNINLVLGDEQFRDDIKATAANIAVVTDKAKSLADDAGTAARSMDAFLVSAESLVTQFNESIQNQEGIIGTLLQDEEFKSQVRDLVKALARSAAQLQDAILRASAASEEIRRLGNFFRRHPSSLLWGKPTGAGLPYTPAPVDGR